MEKNYRLFVRSLPNNITSDQLQKLFDQYGSISNVDIKEKSMNDGSKIAFINITSTNQKLNNCYRDINSTVLEGQNLSVELAKENFLDKLKREREEAQNKSIEKSIVRVSHGPIEPINIKLPTEFKSKQKCLISPTEKSSQDLPEFAANYSLRVGKNNINPDNIDNAKNKCESELKRVASLKQRKQSFKAKEQLIRNALKTVDNKRNKIVFSDDVENSGYNISDKKKPLNNPQLFDDDDDDDSEHNEITFDLNKKQKPHAHSIGNDSRFIIDERFDDEDEEEGDQNENSESRPENREKDKDDLTKEKEKELKILEDVLGKPIIKRDDKSIPPKRTNAMIRYDPTKDDHRKHELKIEEKKSEPKKKKKKKDVMEEEEKEPIPVSNEIFYSVSETLKESLNKKEEGFSLLKTFGAADIPENKINNDLAEAIPHQPSKLGMNFDTKNPFRYDSSESEDEDVPENTINTRNNTKENGFSYNNDSSSYHIDKFFLIDDDPRFKDAEDFFGAFSTAEVSFKELRRELKNIVRSKVRNNVRKTLPWKKKISNVKRVTKKRK